MFLHAQSSGIGGGRLGIDDGESAVSIGVQCLRVVAMLRYVSFGFPLIGINIHFCGTSTHSGSCTPFRNR